MTSCRNDTSILTVPLLRFAAVCLTEIYHSEGFPPVDVAEESLGGAQDMIKEGALEGVSAIAGLHVWPDSPSGTITTKAPAPCPSSLPHPCTAIASRFSTEWFSV